MNTKIDLKSALCGLAIGVLAMLAIGAGTGDASKHGRYTCAAGGESILLIVDSETGQAWALRPGGVSITGSPAGFFEQKSVH